SNRFIHQRALAKALNIKEQLPRATIYYNNYGDFMDLIKKGCNQGLNVKTIFVSIKKTGI
ncbi:MAG: hypothetical protein PHR52_02310, partial [Fermentimonas sp.]|nr:hypothetical protein [Fermentimonas sp.]